LKPLARSDALGTWGEISSAHWIRWVVLALVLVNAGWMIFDGSTALIRGDYVTPGAGRHAGELGPWSEVVRATGLDPRHTRVKLGFVVYGGAYLVAALLFFARLPWGRRLLALTAILGLWYLPFGTLINLAVIILLEFPIIKRGWPT
jgi:hypothetical protein